MIQYHDYRICSTEGLCYPNIKFRPSHVLCYFSEEPSGIGVCWSYVNATSSSNKFKISTPDIIIAREGHASRILAPHSRATLGPCQPITARLSHTSNAPSLAVSQSSHRLCHKHKQEGLQSAECSDPRIMCLEIKFLAYVIWSMETSSDVDATVNKGIGMGEWTPNIYKDSTVRVVHATTHHYSNPQLIQDQLNLERLLYFDQSHHTEDTHSQLDVDTSNKKLPINRHCQIDLGPVPPRGHGLPLVPLHSPTNTTPWAAPLPAPAASTAEEHPTSIIPPADTTLAVWERSTVDGAAVWLDLVRSEQVWDRAADTVA